MSLPPTLVRATDRLIDTLMRVVYAVGPFGNDPANPPDPAQHARTLLHHLSLLVIRLIHRSNNPLPTLPQPTPPQPVTATADTPAAQPIRHAAPSLGLRLPRHPGWLLAILPDAAPALAAELGAALADPALLPLLDADPVLHRLLRPVLRALGLDAPSAPPPEAPPPHPLLPEPPSGPLPHSLPQSPLTTPIANQLPRPTPSHA